MTTPDTSDLPRWLDNADELAKALIERARPARFDIAGTPDELEAVFRLRYRISTEMGWLRPEDVPDGLERDEYDDDNAAQVMGSIGTDLAATARVVYPVKERALPTEAAYDIVVEPRGQVVDVGRAIVAPEYRDGEHRLLGGLSAAVWTAMSSRGHRWAAVAGTKRTLDLFRALGFEVVVLGEPRIYWGAKRYPARFSVPDPGKWM